MDKKLLLLLIGSYFLAFFVNLMPAMKYPDLHSDILDLAVSVLFVFFLLMYAGKGSMKVKIFSMLGVLSGIVVYLFDNLSMGNALIETLANIQYPFYFLFTTPLFGGNLLLDISHEAYSLVLSLFYAIAFGISLYFGKQQVQAAK